MFPTKEDMERIRDCSIKASKTKSPLKQALIAIETVCQRIECADYSELTKEELVDSMNLIYKIAHGCNPYHSCYDSHEDWRRVKDKWFSNYAAEYKEELKK
jgi:hypothetical protein